MAEQKKKLVKQRERGKGKKKERESSTSSPFIVSWSMVETVGLLSVATLKEQSIRNRAQCSPHRLEERGHFPRCWPTLLNPASVNKFSIDSHYDQHTNKASTFHRRENNEIKDMVGRFLYTYHAEPLLPFSLNNISLLTF